MAAADHPPPPGFPRVLPVVLAGALLVYWRVADYARWRSHRLPWRLGRVIGFRDTVCDLPVSGLGDKGVIFDFPTETTSVDWVACFVLAAALALAGCGAPAGEYLPVSAVARGGFATDQEALAEVRGREVQLWGFVDHGNLYGDADAKRVLGEWWSGEGPDPDHWRFDLKAQADDPVGRSFAVIVPNDVGRRHLLLRLAADARGQTATKVFVTGRLSTFHAPTQILDRIGLHLQVRSSQDIRFDPANRR